MVGLGELQGSASAGPPRRFQLQRVEVANFDYLSCDSTDDCVAVIRPHPANIKFSTGTVRIMSGLFGSNASSTAASGNNTNGDISKDIPLTAPPEDGISDLSFSPVSEHLAVASWDKKVRIYEINAQGSSEGKALFEHEQPVLSCCWSKVRIFRSQAEFLC